MGRGVLSAADVPPGFAEALIPGPVNGEWNAAVGVTFDATGRMFVWEREGRVWFKDPSDASFTLLLDITEEVGAWDDHGFLGFALDPNFRVNGYIYLLYVVDRHYLLYFGTPSYDPNANEYFDATIGRLTRYTCSAGNDFRSVVPNSRFILIGETKETGIPICSYTHGVGSLVFGEDGTLLVSCGEGASANGADSGGAFSGSYAPQASADGILQPKEDVGAFRSQLVDTLSGKILRLDPATGDGEPTNPFYDPAHPRAAKSRVWALGLRNPFRFTLKPNSGSHNPADGQPGILYVGDVGWDTWESAKVVTTPGQNFGWPIYEGLSPVPGYSIDVNNLDALNPLYPGSGCSQYFSFKDLLHEDTLNPAGQPPFPNPCNASQRIPVSIPQFLHARPVLDWNHYTVTTRTPTYGGSGQAQIANVGDPGSPVSGTPFAGNVSIGGTWYTGTGFPEQYRNLYYFADWGHAVVKTLALDQYDKPFALGSYLNNAGAVVCITQHPTDGNLYYVTYNDVAGTAAVIQLSYAGNRTPVASASADVYYGPTALTVHLSSDGSSDPDGQPITFSWNFGDGSPISTEANPTHIFSAPPGVPTKFIVTLTVTDSGGLSAQSTLNVSVNNTPPTVNITSPINGTLLTPNVATTVNLVADVHDNESSDAQLQYKWQTFLHHNDHDHSNPPDTNHTTTSILAALACDGINVYYYRIFLTVTDPAGLSTTREVRLFPDCGPNTAPTISDIPNQAAFLGQPLGPIGFTIGDAETPAVNLQLSATSSNTTLVPINHIVFGGSGANRTITITPAGTQSGASTITVTVTDGPLTASDSFLLTATQGPTPTPTPTPGPFLNQVVAFSFSEGIGTATADNSGSGHNGVLVNGPTWTAGKYGNGVSLDGVDDYVSVANPSTLNLGTSDFTIAAWVKRQATGIEDTILSKTDAGAWVSGGKEFFISGSDSTLAFGSNGVAEIHSFGTITNDGLWHYVAVTFLDSSNTITLYIDGILSGSGPLVLPADGGSHVIKVGGHPAGHNFHGQMDEFRIFNRALSANEVQGIMSNPILPPPTPTPAPTATPTPTPVPTLTPTPTPTPTLLPTVTISGTISYCSNPGPVPNTRLTLSGDATSSTLSDGSANYIFTGLASGGSYTVTPTKADLVPGSVGINTLDVIAVQKHFLGSTEIPPGCRLTAANVVPPAAINTLDVIAIQHFFLGLTTGIGNVGKYQFTPASRTYSGVVTNQTGQNFDALIFGDVAGPFADRAGGPPQSTAGNDSNAGEIPAPLAAVGLRKSQSNNPEPSSSSRRRPRP